MGSFSLLLCESRLDFLGIQIDPFSLVGRGIQLVHNAHTASRFINHIPLCELTQSNNKFSAEADLSNISLSGIDVQEL